jgi:hypothetical protein
MLSENIRVYFIYKRLIFLSAKPLEDMGKPTPDLNK